jgi:hypothetical protein
MCLFIYLFIYRLYMFRATPIFRNSKRTLQTIGVCVLVLMCYSIGSGVGRGTLALFSQSDLESKSDCEKSARVPQPTPDSME